MIQPGYVLQEVDAGRYLTIPDLDRIGADHFFALKTSRRKPGDHPPRFGGCRVLTSRQVHRDQVGVVLDEDQDREMAQTEFDALVTDVPGLFIGVYTADCLPVLMLDPVRKVVAAAHAGWRGSLMEISGKTVQKMVQVYGSRPADLHVALGPSIGPCCYEVGNEVLRRVDEQYSGGSGLIRRLDHGKGMLDLLELNRRQLLRAGITEDHFYSTGFCTSCHPELFSSYRREGIRSSSMLNGIRIGT